MRNWNKKRVEFSREQRSDAFVLADMLLRNGYDVFMWQCEGNVVVEYEWHDPEFREGEYVYIDPERQYVEDYDSEDEDHDEEYYNTIARELREV